ncbi:hypothetical protein JW319_22570 [Enterobacter cloacae subsp. cloacae]|uniref:hypothetical protein n=1 Tax=Enterobacter cloacae TaxID=550 RepID=UPI001C5B39D3|nr:hypothetical protein [Enterobacter cloacae]MBW4204140.1 hypothetical protein [Enterobacter cloacae subsp. cloacae]
MHPEPTSQLVKMLIKSLFAGVFLVLCVSSNAKTFQVQVTGVPQVPHAYFTARIAAVDFDDPAPNFCYQKRNCYFAGFVNSKSWGEQGKQSYITTDTFSIERRERVAYSAKTMGELAQGLRDNNLLYKDMSGKLYPQDGDDPTFCIYAAVNYGQQAGTLASNCADAPVPPASCDLTPESLTFDWGILPNTKADEIELSRSIKVTCTEPTTVRLSISGEFISLNGDINTRAEFNLGSGWTGSTKVTVRNSEVIEMKSRLKGLRNSSGEYSGSSVLVFEQL